jgi:KRAB domain-containing zinc finger protein
MIKRSNTSQCVNIQEKSYKGQSMAKIIPEYTQSVLYQANFRNTRVESSNINSHQNGNTRGPCKHKNCINCLNLCSITGLHQGIHIGKKEHNGIVLDKVFNSTQILRLKQTNSGKKPYKCSERARCFTKKCKLRQHQRIHTGEKPYRCSECDKCFFHKYSLNIHQRIHTGEKPYKCSECDKCCNNKHSPSSHQIIHTRKKPYKCSKCDKCFTHKYDLMIH